MNNEEIEELKEFTIDLTDIDELALGLEICSKKSNMVIQEFIDTIFQLQQENQSLKKENKILRENAEHNDKVVDKVNWENQKLKKQLEEYKKLGFEHLNDKCNKLENQQKEFIEFLENEKDRCLTFYSSAECMYAYDVFKDVLSKYKEIIDKLESGDYNVDSKR